MPEVLTPVERLERLACEVLGHARRRLRTFQTLDMKVWVWISCPRCGYIFKGTCPPDDEVADKVLFGTYEIRERYREALKTHRFVEAMTLLNELAPHGGGANCVLTGISDPGLVD